MKDINLILPKKSLLIGDNGTTFSLPNYDGELYTAAGRNTPFLTLIGGINGGLESSNVEFPTSSLYDLDTIEQPAITENQSITGATPSHTARTQNKNVAQIFHKAINVSYQKLANGGRLSGLNTAGAQNNVQDEVDFQISVKLQSIARSVNYTFHNGVYNLATTADTANKTRGMLSAVSTSVDAEGAPLSKILFDKLLRDMHEAGAEFNNMAVFVRAYQKQVLTNLYGLAPTDRTVGGMNIERIVTDMGEIIIALDRDIPKATIGVYDLSVCAPVFNVVPEKGRLFYEALAKTGASESGQVFGIIGLDHGPGFMHGSITNLLVSEE